MDLPFRMLAFDLDGTLLEKDGSLADESAAFLRELSERGVVVAAATGRRLWSALPKLRGAGLSGSCVVHNGALVADIGLAKTLCATPLTREEVAKLVARVEARRLGAVLFTDAPRGPREILHRHGGADPTGFLAWYARYAAGHLTALEGPLEADPAPPAGTAGESVMRVVAHGNESQMRALVAEVEAEDGSGVRGFVQREMAVPGFRAELLARGADKWRGIEWIARRASIAPAAIVAVGDEANDIEMLREAGHSFAAPGSSAPARAAAREIVEGDGPRALVAALRRVFASPVRGEDFGTRDC